jgi:Flp pilus assembly protein TadG
MESLMQRSITDLFSRQFTAFRTDTRATVAVLWGICIVPIMIAVSMALDMANSSHMKTEMQAAADAAVLAAATKLAVNADDADKEQLALDTFYANLSPTLADHVSAPDVDIDFPTKQVHLEVQLQTETLLTNLVTDNIMLRVDATATVSPGTPICMMALSAHAEEALSIQGTADVMATECAVHVNSDDDDALHQNGSGTATAESFCVHGSHSGSNYTPPPKDNCWYENDPVKAQFASDWAAAGIDSMPCTYSNLPQINTDALTVTILTPGVYCGGLTIKKGIVQLLEGQMYVFRNGPLEVQAQGTLQGIHTPVLFTGDSTTRLVTQAGANIITSARSTGLFKGIAFAQDPNSVPSSPNLIIGGGQMEINGIMYFPKQPLKITGNGDIGTSAAQFALIADTIAIEGNGQLNIKIGQNYQSTGLPDLPEAHEVVYLID